MADKTYCISPCPFKDCHRHYSANWEKITEHGKKYVSVADYAPVCRRYIAHIVEEVSNGLDQH